MAVKSLIMYLLLLAIYDISSSSSTAPKIHATDTDSIKLFVQSSNPETFDAKSKTGNDNMGRNGNIKKEKDNALILPYVISGEFSKKTTVQVNRTIEYIIEYTYKTSLLWRKALRVTVLCPASSYTYPVMVVVRQQRGVLSWQLPLEPPPNSHTIEEYKTVSRTLCPINSAKNSLHFDPTQNLFVEVSTLSHVSLNFSVQAELLDDFVIDLKTSRSVNLSPGEPVYYLFQFPDDIDMVLVKGTSNDDICAMLSIQNVSCPVFDTEESIHYGNFYQTMTTRAGITVRKVNYPNGFYIVALTLSVDDECAPGFQHIYLHRTKQLEISVEEKITFLEYMTAIFAGLGFCAFFYVVVIILACVEYMRAKKRALLLDRPTGDESLGGSVEDDMFISYASASTALEGDAANLCNISTCSTLDEDEYDILEDADSEKDVFRTKTILFISDLARKNTRVLRRKSFLYIFGLLTVAIFYAVPVVQLVVTYQKVLDETGNQDICYYNFWCAHPLGPLSDFNHVYSNIAYILFGVLFIGICARRERRHRKASKIDRKIDKYFGIPQHYGMFYAMGGALIMEGLLSGCYHICPNYSNFQFDTAFMYVIAVLCMLKIYQTRHPDINASANAAYLALAFAILFGVIGVLNGSIYFWVFFSIIYISVCLILSAQIYYMGRWTFNLSRFRRLTFWMRQECHTWRTLLQPMYCDRMILLLIVNAANWGLSIYGVITTPKDFASYLLIIFLTNLLLYTGFYIIMKLRHGESILLQPLIYLVLCGVAWGASAYFFLHPMTTWEMTPAHSRQYNNDCLLLHFYDTHDIWHFLSSSAMFFGFMLLLTLDDDLTFTPRERILVF